MGYLPACEEFEGEVVNHFDCPCFFIEYVLANPFGLFPTFLLYLLLCQEFTGQLPVCLFPPLLLWVGSFESKLILWLLLGAALGVSALMVFFLLAACQGPS